MVTVVRTFACAKVYTSHGQLATRLWSAVQSSSQVGSAVQYILCVDYPFQVKQSSSMLLLVEWVLLLFNWPKVCLLCCVS